MDVMGTKDVRYPFRLNHFTNLYVRTGLMEGEHDHVSWSWHKLLRLVDRGLADRHGVSHGLAPD